MISIMLVISSILLVLGVPIAFSLGVSSIPAIIIADMPINLIIQQMFNSCESFVLLAIPLFIYAGMIMDKSGITANLVNLAKALTGFVSGGLGISVVVGEMFFSGISGSTAADVSAVGSLLLPALDKAGYPKKYSISLISAASAMGILIPPCNMMVVLGSLAGISVAALFMGGILPAVVMALFIALKIFIDAKRLNFPKEKSLALREYGSIFIRSSIPMGMPIIIFGGILGGFFTPTEAAGVAVVYAVIVGLFVYRSISPKQLLDMALETGVLTGLIMILVGVCATFSYLITLGRVPEMVATWLLSISTSPWFFLVVVSIVFIFIGSLMEGLGAILIFVPVFLPLVTLLHVNPVHFGIVIIASIGIGLFLPPVGVGVLIACSIGRISPYDILKDLSIFLTVLCIALGVIIFFPWFTLVVPRLAGLI